MDCIGTGGLFMHGQDTGPSHGDEISASSKSRRFTNRAKRKSERCAPSEDGEGISSEQVLMGARERNQAKADFLRQSEVKEQKACSERRFIWWEKRINERSK